MLSRLSRVSLPPGYRLVPAGEIESQEESFGGIGGAMLVSIFGILATLVLEFRTFRSVLIVASVIPLGIAGRIATLLLVGQTLSFTATIGFAALPLPARPPPPSHPEPGGAQDDGSLPDAYCF